MSAHLLPVTVAWLARLCDAGADLHALTEEARALIADRDTTPDEMREFIGHLVDIYAGAAGRAVAEERDRLRRALAVERGDESQAPDGWQHGTPGSWHHNGLVGRCRGPEVILRRYGGDDEAEGDLRTTWQRSPKDDGPRESWTTALEAMLAITAEHEARKGGEVSGG